MAPFRRSPFLTCFYCGQRTTTRNDGRVRRFECRQCAATNYLDEHGDITDPPISTTAATPSTTPHFVSNPDPFPDDLLGGGPSPSSDGGDGRAGSSTVFCKTCLKNQHLFIASLAQYFPDDPNHPDTPELERRYFRFRQGLEQRYPQVCADCEPKVLERIRAAGYTAKTDHLRRMVDYSRRVRATQRSYLNTAQQLGRWLWWAGLLLQLLWQAGALWGGLAASSGAEDAGDTAEGGFSGDALVDVDGSGGGLAGPGSGRPFLAPLSVDGVPAVLQTVLRLLAARAGQLQSLCIGATLAGCWWNPYFVQTMRGFTKPLIGIPTWYAYQATTVFVRLALARVAGQGSLAAAAAAADAAGAGKGMAPTVVGVHVFAFLFALYLHARAPRAIRKDLRPLFEKLPTAPLTPQRSPTARSVADEASQREAYERRRSAGLEILSDVLDEISSSPAQDAHSLAGTSPLRRKESDATDGWDGWQPSHSTSFNRFSTPTRIGGPGAAYDDDDDDDDNNGVAGQTHSYAKQYGDDEMDWTPTRTGLELDPPGPFQPSSPSPATRTSPHRAFRTFDAAQTRAFGETPVADDRGPFWYKVPPAPASIAQRIFNRPNAPRLVQRQAGSSSGAADSAQGTFRFSGHANAGADPFRRPQRDAAEGGRRTSAGLASSVEFAPPSFFAEDIQKKRAMNGGSGGGGDDDAGSFLSDLFSQAFTLGGGGREEGDADGADAPAGARRHRRGKSSGSLPYGGGPTAGNEPGAADTSLSLGRHVAQLVTLLASSSVLYVLHTRPDNVGGSDDDGTGRAAGLLGGLAGLPRGSLDRLSLRGVEAMAVGLCLLVAAVLARESARRWRRAVAVRQAATERPRTPAAAQTATAPLLPSAVGVLLGLASLAQAGWMAYGLYTAAAGASDTLSSADPAAADMYAYDVDYGAETLAVHQQQPVHGPWSGWQVAWLHGTVVAHQVWNLATR